jgi:NAD(P)-dependent dehydrogenase (short-subunit alcohol dehydrogenase family)
VLVTGGDSGIGFGAVQAFYLECAMVLLAGHSEHKSKAAFDAIKALQVPASCSDSPPTVTWAAADISNATEAANLISRAVQELGGLDIAVNNAGTAGSKGTFQIGSPGFVDSEGKFYDESIMAVNFRGTLFCMNAQIAHWLGTGTNGSMVNIASIAGEVAWAGPLYTSSKWAMIGFTKQAALANARKGIRINAVAPGAVNTSMLRNGMSPTDPRWIAEKEYFEKMIPMGRIAEPWEMAGPITFLASDMAAYVTGQVLTADGDFTEGAPGPQRQASGAVVSETTNVIFT